MQIFLEFDAERLPKVHHQQLIVVAVFRGRSEHQILTSDHQILTFKDDSRPTAFLDFGHFHLFGNSMFLTTTTVQL